MLGLRQLTRLRAELVELVSDLKRRLLTLLDQPFPEFETFFREEYCKTALALLQAYPTPSDLATVDVDTLTKLLETHSNYKIERAKAEFILKAAQTSFGVPYGQKATRIQIRLLAAQILHLEGQQKELNREIATHVALIPNCLTTISGIGPIISAVLLGEIGDIRRFRNAKALVAYPGIDPNVSQSGEFTAKKTHLTKRGSKHLRRAVCLAARAATRNDPAFQALLQKKMAEGKHYHLAMGAVASKLMHVIYAVMRDNKPYYPLKLAGYPAA